MHPAQVGVEEVETRAGPPVAEQSGLDVLGSEGPAQQRVVHEVDLAGGQVVGGPEVGIELAELLGPGLRWSWEQSVPVIGLSSANGSIGSVSRSGDVRSRSIWQGGWVHVLVVNAGSSRLKLRLLDGQDDAVVASADLPSARARRTLAAVLGAFSTRTRDSMRPATGWSTAARVVHAGPSSSTRAPTPGSTPWPTWPRCTTRRPGRASTPCRSLRPDLPRWPASTPPSTPTCRRRPTYAVPRAWRDRWGIRRFGFHGLSHAWASRRAAKSSATPRRTPPGHRPPRCRRLAGCRGLRTLGRHHHGLHPDGGPGDGHALGQRRSRARPVGATPRRAVRRRGRGRSRTRVGAARAGGSPGTSTTCWRPSTPATRTPGSPTRSTCTGSREVAAMCAAMGGMDGLVFTGGAGEGEPRLRADTCAGLGFLGLNALTYRNEEQGGDRVISGSAPAVLVVAAREDIEIARHVRQLLTD